MTTFRSAHAPCFSYIAREHKISSIGGYGKTEIVFCICGLRCENEDDGDDGFLAGYCRHIAELTEQAVREQIAAQIEAQPPEYFSATMITKVLAAEIARGEA